MSSPAAADLCKGIFPEYCLDSPSGVYQFDLICKYLPETCICKFSPSLTQAELELACNADKDGVYYNFMPTSLILGTVDDIEESLCIEYLAPLKDYTSGDHSFFYY